MRCDYNLQVPGHSNIVGNFRLYVLARRDTIIQLSDEFSTLGIPLKTCKLIIVNATIDFINNRWAASDNIIINQVDVVNLAFYFSMLFNTIIR